MLLRHKKTQGEDQNWCVILSPISSEIDRKKVAQKIASVFTLSLDEALDLVSNTPIIILDNLSRSLATKLKDFFRVAGAETILTNDIFQKRKCYRTVWPEPPSLSFLQDWSPLAPSKEEHQELHPEEALNEIRSMSPDEKIPAQPSLTSIPFLPRTDREQLAEEAERWRRECMKLREESREFREQIERLQKDQSQEDFTSREDHPWLEEKEKDMKEAQLLLEHANEKYEVLRQEYANARHLYEEKIAQLLQEGEQSRRKVSEIQDVQKSLDREKQTASSQIQQKDAEIARILEEAAKDRQLKEHKILSQTQENEQLKRQLVEINESLRARQREREIVEEQLTRKESDLQVLSEESRKNRAIFDQKMSQHLEEVTKFQFQLKEAQEKIQMFQRAKEELEITVNTQTDQIGHWRERHDLLSPKLLALEKEIHIEKTLREAIEIRQRDLEKNQTRLLQDLEDKIRSIQDWEEKYLAADRQFSQLKEVYENQEKMLQYQMKQSESREKELEVARRQIRDLNAQNEHRETVQKRTLLASQLVEKEGVLRKLVQEQEKVETEIKAREESMRNLLAQQESVEKEIIEAKQAQRHLSELAKKDQLKGRRTVISHDGSSSLEETSHD